MAIDPSATIGQTGYPTRIANTPSTTVAIANTTADR
jgi:hypothetical protein